MIKACRSKIGFRLLRFFVVRALKHRFAAVYIEGLEHLQNISPDRPIIVCANHHNWWDGFFAVFLAGFISNRKLYLMQEEKHLQRYSFFRFAGAFGINLDSPRASLAGIRHALRLLKNPECLLWIFPEGRLTSPTAPYEIRGGAKLLAEKSDAAIVPVVLRIAWREESWPLALIKVGSEVGNTSIAESLETLRSSSEDFFDPLVDLKSRPHLRGKTSLNKTWDAAMQQTPKL